MEKSRKNLEVKLLIGIPASSKSTWAKDFISKNRDWARVSRDEFRLMLKNAQVCEPKVENMISKLMDNAIISALNSKLNVIVDNTNLKIEYINHFIELVKHKADVDFQIFDIPLKTALERDANREMRVGDDIVKRMYNDYLRLFDSNFDFSVRKKQPYIFKNKKPNGLPKAVCVDLDGTLAHMNDKRSPYDWFKCHLDDIDHVVLEHIKIYKNNGYKIIIFTARDQAATESTVKWLSDNKVPYDDLITKGLNDNRKDYIVKREMLEKHVLPFHDIFVMLDDKDGVVDVYRKMGLKTFQVEASLN
jgi:predicted kinase